MEHSGREGVTWWERVNREGRVGVATACPLVCETGLTSGVCVRGYASVIARRGGSWRLLDFSFTYKTTRTLQVQLGGSLQGWEVMCTHKNNTSAETQHPQASNHRNLWFVALSYLWVHPRFLRKYAHSLFNTSFLLKSFFSSPQCSRVCSEIWYLLLNVAQTFLHFCSKSICLHP